MLLFFGVSIVTQLRVIKLKDNGTKNLFAHIESVTFPDNEYNIKTPPNVFVPELFACYLTANLFLGGHLGSRFRKIKLCVT